MLLLLVYTEPNKAVMKPPPCVILDGMAVCPTSSTHMDSVLRLSPPLKGRTRRTPIRSHACTFYAEQRGGIKTAYSRLELAVRGEREEKEKAGLSHELSMT